MKSSSKQFAVAVAVATAACLIFQFVWNSFAPEELRFQEGFLLLGLLALFTSVFHLLLLYSSKGSAQAFVRKYMVTAVLKFFFYILLLAAFFFIYKTQRMAVVIHFMVYYVVFTMLEVMMLYSALTRK